MQEREFVDSGRESWERLAAAVTRARSEGTAHLGAPALRQMHEDYRRAAADLAYAQTHFPASSTLEYLNRLVGQAHGELYGASPRRFAGVLTFLARDYPRLLRREWRVLAIAALVLVGAGVFGFAASYLDYPLARMFLPEQLRDGVTDGFVRTGRQSALSPAVYPIMSAAVGVNNVQVAVMAFAGGMTFGALTLYSMFQNGALLGVLAGVFAQAHLSPEFWALIVPHGALEIPAIAIAGGAGLKLAAALLFPGDLPRMTSLRHASPVAVRMFLGAVPIFAIAAAIEGFFTPTSVPVATKLAVGALAALLLASYVLLAGRGEAET